MVRENVLFRVAYVFSNITPQILTNIVRNNLQEENSASYGRISYAPLKAYHKCATTDKFHLIISSSHA